ncbi:MAG: CheR family methyltransferase, partial [Myxococcota bacterium]
MALNHHEPNFEYIRRLVHERAAIVLEDSKSYLVTARLTPLAEKEGFSSLAELVDLLRRQSPHSPLVKDVVEAMTTNETSFFRDIAPFDALRTEVLPAVIKSNTSRRQLNLWCAACASGQEPYSVLFEIEDHFPQLNDWKVSFWATDISSEMCERTRVGEY